MPDTGPLKHINLQLDKIASFIPTHTQSEALSNLSQNSINLFMGNLILYSIKITFDIIVACFIFDNFVQSDFYGFFNMYCLITSINIVLH